MPTKKNKAPLNAKTGVWGLNAFNMYNLPDGTKYNPSNISIATFRKMRNDYQINACLNVLTFTLQKIDWYVEDGSPKAKKHIEESIQLIWNELIRGFTKAFWSGYSPMVKVFTLDDKGLVIYKRIKDLAPETCIVKTREDGVYDGFVQFPGEARKEDIPIDQSLWYPNEMEDGNYYGRSRLVAAYKPWYNSEIIHLFANRYYERYAEPLLLGRAPNEIVEDSYGGKKDAMDIMQSTLEGVKSHATATIPSDVDDQGNKLYDINILESQMRGVDFDTYLKRLDMEKARAIFIPDLLLGAGDVGSYELGKEHKATFLAGLMGIMDDITAYINKYVVPPLVKYNFGEKAQVPEFKYLPLSKVNEDLIVNIVTAMVNGKMIRPSTEELSKRLGIPLEEIEIVTAEPTNVEGKVDKNGNPVDKKEKPVDKKEAKKEIVQKQMARLENSIRKSIDDGTTLQEQYDNLSKIKLGYVGRMFDKVGEEEGDEFYEKQKKIISCLQDSFVKGEKIEKMVEKAELILNDGVRLARDSDFIDASVYMSIDIRRMPVIYRNLFTDVFKEEYDISKNVFVSQRRAEEAVSRAWNEKTYSEEY